MNTDYIINWILNARDNTNGAFEKMKGQVGSLQSQWGSLQTLISTGVVASFAALIAHSIELGDKLWTLHERTGISVESLGGLSLSADQSGTSIEALMKGSKHLGELMTDAVQNPAGEAAQAFQKLGINIRDTTTGALLPFDQILPKIADKFNTWKDGTEKSTDANYLFSRSGQELLGMFKMGGEEIAKNIELYKQLGGHTNESAEAADAFSDKMKVVKLASEGLWNTITAGLLPTMNKLADMYIDAQKNSDKYNNAATLTALVVKSLATEFMVIAQALQFVGNLIGAFAAALVVGFQTAIDETVVKIKAFGDILLGIGAGMSGRYLEAAEYFKSGMAKINDQAEGGSATAVEKVRTIWSSFAENSVADWQKWDDRIVKLWDDTGNDVEKKASKTGGQIAAPILKAAKEVKESDFDKELRKFGVIYSEALIEMASGFGEMTKSEKAFLELVSRPEWNKLSSNQQQAISDAFGVANAQEHTNKEMKTFNDLAKDAAAYAAKFREEQEKWKEKINDNALAFEELIKGINDQTQGLKYEGIEHDKYLARLALEKDWYAGLIPTAEEYRDRLDRINTAYNELGNAQKLKEMTQANVQFWQDLDTSAHGFFDSLLEGGGNAFKQLGSMLKKYLIDLLYQMTLKQWIINLGVSSGGLSGSAAAAMNGGNNSGLMSLVTGAGNMSSTLSGWGTLLSGGSSFLEGGSSLASLLGGYTSGGAIGAGAGMYGAFAGSAAGEALGLSVATTTAEGVGLSTMTALGAAVPVIGWVIAAAAILWSLFGNKGGGPKSGGFAQSGGSNLGRFFTPNQADVGLSKVTSQFQDSYKSIVAGLGGQVIDDLGFAIGYDTDPNGSADNRVSAAVTGAGGSILWQSLNKTAGRDDEDLQKVMDIQMATAMGQAIKNSNLTGIVANVWKNVGEITQEKLKNLVEFSQQLHDMETAVDADVAADARKVEEQAQLSSIEKYRLAGQAVRDLAAAYDGSAASTAKLSAATSQFRMMSIQLIIAIDQVAESFRKTIIESRRQVEMTGLQGDPLRAYLQNEIDKLMSDMASTTDPAKVQELGQKINADVLQMWGSLDPDVQAQQKEKYLSWFDQIGAVVQTRLDTIKAEITGEGETSYSSVMQSVGQAMRDASDGITEAANTMATAADTMNNAANKIANGANIVITVDTSTGEVGVSGQ